MVYIWFMYLYVCCYMFFFKQKTAYEMRISDWSSDVCSSDLSTTEMAGRHWVSQDLSVAGLPHSTGRWPRLTGWAQCKTDRSSSELMALAAFTGRALSATRHRQRVNRLFGLSEPAQTGAKRPRSSL